MKYSSIFSCYIFDEVKNGYTVYALDKKLLKVVCINLLTANEIVAVMKSAKNEPTRYEFWCEKETEVTEVTEEKEINENE